MKPTELNEISRRRLLALGGLSTGAALLGPGLAYQILIEMRPPPLVRHRRHRQHVLRFAQANRRRPPQRRLR